MKRIRKGRYNYDRQAYVYLFRINKNVVKIGMSSDIKSRLKTLRSGNPDIEELYSVWCVAATDCEKALHKHFESFKIKGYKEFFHDVPCIHDIFDKIVCNEYISPHILNEIIKSTV